MIDQQQAIERLAAECDVPIDEVDRIYAAARAELAADARVVQYLPIFVARNVRQILKRRRTGLAAAAALDRQTAAS
jgi:hypothetical protein